MRLFLFCLVLLASIQAVLAQDDPLPPVTDDDVNAVASQLYCPVCEGIPLDACGTDACVEWHNEIRQQLASGMSGEQVIDDFVRRFGDRVVGTPQDDTLRLVSLIVPILFVLGGIGGMTYFAAQRRQDVVPHLLDKAAGQVTNTDDIYAQIERDIEGTIHD